MNSTVRRLFFTLLYHTGALWLWRLWRRNAVIILTVHGVVDEDREHEWRPLRRRLSLQQLQKTLRVVGRHYRFVSMATAVEMLASRQRLQPRSIVLTFDDGYRSQVSDAAPLLLAHGVAATVFVATGHAAAQQPFWFDRLDYAIQQNPQRARQLIVAGRELALRADTDLAEAFSALRRAAKEMPRDDREMCREFDELANRLESECGRRLLDILHHDPLSAPLTVDEVRAGTTAFTFGSHTVDHLRIHRVPAELAREQLSQSKAALERWTGKPCRFFCYPDGGFNEEVAELVRKCGYDAAVTTERGMNWVGADLMTLRRIDVPLSGNAAEIVAQISGFGDWITRSRTRSLPA